MDDYTLEADLSAEQVIIAYSLIYGVIGIICAIIVKYKEQCLIITLFFFLQFE